VSTDDGGVLDRAQEALDEGSSHMAERTALRARLTAYIAERSGWEAKGTVPRGVRRRGERLLEEVSALEERVDTVTDRREEADAPIAEDDAQKATDPKRRRDTVGGEAKPPPPPPPPPSPSPSPPPSPRGTRPPSRGRGG
jgi:hypothetical protein